MKKENGPLVSVIITTYKRADYLKRAVNSVLNQSYKNLEILVIDDNDPSTEYRKSTEKLMDSFSAIEEVKYIKHDKNKNGAAARNTGLKFASGKYVTYLDDDDTYRTDKVLEQVMFLETNKKFDAVYCGWNKKGIDEAPETEGDISFEILSGELLIRTNTIMMNKDIAISIGGWNELYRRNQEAVYLLRFFNAGYLIGSVPKILVDFDNSDRSNESNPKQYEEDFVFFLSDHKDTIERTAKDNKRNKNIIYSLRYLSVFLRYLKNRKLKNASRIYVNRLINMPIRFNKDLIRYTINKIK